MRKKYSSKERARVEDVQIPTEITEFVAYLYSGTMPTTISFGERLNRAIQKFKLDVECFTEEIKLAKRIYFETHIDTETFWSLSELLHKNNEYIRDVNVDDADNADFKTRNAVAKDLPDLRASVEALRKDLFRGDREAEDMTRIGKQRSKTLRGNFEEAVSGLPLNWKP